MVAVWQVFNDMQPIAALTFAPMSYHDYHHPFPQHSTSQPGWHLRNTIPRSAQLTMALQYQRTFISCKETLGWCHVHRRCNTQHLFEDNVWQHHVWHHPRIRNITLRAPTRKINWKPPLAPLVPLALVGKLILATRPACPTRPASPACPRLPGGDKRGKRGKASGWARGARGASGASGASGRPRGATTLKHWWQHPTFGSIE